MKNIGFGKLIEAKFSYISEENMNSSQIKR
jgi:hypothetical protein